MNEYALNVPKQPSGPVIDAEGREWERIFGTYTMWRCTDLVPPRQKSWVDLLDIYGPVMDKPAEPEFLKVSTIMKGMKEGSDYYFPSGAFKVDLEMIQHLPSTARLEVIKVDD